MTLCSVPDCDKKYVAKGYCDRHYRHFKKYGKPIKTIRDVSELGRFNSKIKINLENGCYEWTDKLCVWGYGMFRLKNSKQVKAHRYAYSYVHGEIPSSKVICHHCDNPKCVNIDHLFIGTILDNNLDKIKKKRDNVPKGENHFRAVGTIELVTKVKKLLKEINSAIKVAKQLNVAVHFVENIKYERTWKHVQS